MPEQLSRRPDRHRTVSESLWISGDNPINARRHGRRNLDVVLEVVSRQSIGIKQYLSIDGENFKAVQANTDIGPGLIRSDEPASDIKQIGD